MIVVKDALGYTIVALTWKSLDSISSRNEWQFYHPIVFGEAHRHVLLCRHPAVKFKLELFIGSESVGDHRGARSRIHATVRRSKTSFVSAASVVNRWSRWNRCRTLWHPILLWNQFFWMFRVSLPERRGLQSSSHPCRWRPELAQQLIPGPPNRCRTVGRKLFYRTKQIGIHFSNWNCARLIQISIKFQLITWKWRIRRNGLADSTTRKRCSSRQLRCGSRHSRGVDERNCILHLLLTEMNTNRRARRAIE